MEVGLRVVRGPDWKLNDSESDGGEGFVGTVVEVGGKSSSLPENLVWVQWDSGIRHDHRAGYYGAYDLYVLDSTTIGIKRDGIECRSCKQNPILGMCWKCQDCDTNFNLCTSCYMADKHPKQHAFLRIVFPDEDGVSVGKRLGAKKIQSRGIFPGAKVVRGIDWRWKNQDGGEGKEGVVMELKNWKTSPKRGVLVSWDCAKKETYRLGAKGKVDLKCVKPGTGGFYYKDHLPKLGEWKCKLRRKKTGRAEKATGFRTSPKINVNNPEISDAVYTTLSSVIVEAMNSDIKAWADDDDRVNQKEGDKFFLPVCCFYGLLEFVMMLLEAAVADVIMRDHNNFTILHAAAMEDKSGMVTDLLLKKEVDPSDNEDTLCVTPPHLVVELNSEGAAKNFASYINLRNLEDESTLHSASDLGLIITVDESDLVLYLRLYKATKGKYWKFVRALDNPRKLIQYMVPCTAAMTPTQLEYNNDYEEIQDDAGNGAPIFIKKKKLEFSSIFRLLSSKMGSIGITQDTEDVSVDNLMRALLDAKKIKIILEVDEIEFTPLVSKKSTVTAYRLSRYLTTTKAVNIYCALLKTTKLFIVNKKDVCRNYSMHATELFKDVSAKYDFLSGLINIHIAILKFLLKRHLALSPNIVNKPTPDGDSAIHSEVALGFQDFILLVAASGSPDILKILANEDYCRLEVGSNNNEPPGKVVLSSDHTELGRLLWGEHDSVEAYEQLFSQMAQTDPEELTEELEQTGPELELSDSETSSVEDTPEPLNIHYFDIRLARRTIGDGVPSQLAPTTLNEEGDQSHLKANQRQAASQTSKEENKKEGSGGGPISTETDDIPDRLLCCVCLCRQKNITFQCGHMNTCEECANRITECPECKAVITSRLTTYY